MTQIVLEGTAYDGSYPLDDGFTMRELHTIKTVAGVRGAELSDAFASGDTDLVVAFALIALRRAGVDADTDVLWDAEAGAIRVEFGDEPDDEENPPVAAGSTQSSGGSSPAGSGRQESDPKRTGGRR